MSATDKWILSDPDECGISTLTAPPEDEVFGWIVSVADMLGMTVDALLEEAISNYSSLRRETA